MNCTCACEVTHKANLEKGEERKERKSTLRDTMSLFEELEDLVMANDGGKLVLL